MKKNKGKLVALLLAGAVALTAFPPMRGYAAEVVDKENTFIENDETGIPDSNLYATALSVGDSNTDGKLSVAEAEMVTALYPNAYDFPTDDPMGEMYPRVSLKGISNFVNLNRFGSMSCTLTDLEELSTLKNLQEINGDFYWGEDCPDLHDLPLTRSCFCVWGWPLETREEIEAKLPPLLAFSEEWCMINHLEPPVEVIIPNDETGIPDKVLYDAVLELADNYSIIGADGFIENGNGDGKLSVAEAARIELFDFYGKENKKVQDLTGISYLSKAGFVRIDNCEITDISELADMQSLCHLELRDNKIDDISALNELCNKNRLLTLVVSGNEISTLPDWTSNTSLDLKKGTSLYDDEWRVNFFGNQITESEARAKLPKHLTENQEWFDAQGFLKDAPSDNDDTIFTEDEFDVLLEQNRHNVVEINLDNGVSFTFPAGSMHEIEGKTEYDFRCTIVEDLSKLPQTAQETFLEKNFIAKILYNYSGELPGTAQIKINVGTQYSGQTLYYYLDNEDGTYTLMQEAVVDEKGYITIIQNHCSNYVILGEKLDADNGTENDESKDDDTENGDAENVESPKTGDMSLNGDFILVALSGLLLIAFLNRKQKENSVS